MCVESQATENNYDAGLVIALINSLILFWIVCTCA